MILSEIMPKLRAQDSVDFLKFLAFHKISNVDQSDDLKFSLSSFFGPSMHDNKMIQIWMQNRREK